MGFNCIIALMLLYCASAWLGGKVLEKKRINPPPFPLLSYLANKNLSANIVAAMFYNSAIIEVPVVFQVSQVYLVSFFVVSQLVGVK